MGPVLCTHTVVFLAHIFPVSLPVDITFSLVLQLLSDGFKKKGKMGLKGDPNHLARGPFSCHRRRSNAQVDDTATAIAAEVRIRCLSMPTWTASTLASASTATVKWHW